jgi:CAAX prenyl protease-like protein
MLPKKLREYLAASPLAVRVAPFVVFLLLTGAQGQFGVESAYWFYFAKTLIGAWMVLAVWPLIREFKWAMSWEAVLVGVGVFVMWVGLEGRYPGLDQLTGGGGDSESSGPWNPHLVFGQGAILAWFFILVRTLGSTLVVPPLEEVVFRSTVYRYVVDPDFEKVSLKKFHWGALLITSTIFAVEHNQWLSGFICGLAYQWLVIRKGRLGDAMTAHAITNFLLALWVVGRGAWQFW